MSGPTDRQVQILRLLAQRTTPVTNAEVARSLRISPRTVRSDISSLNRVVGGHAVIAAPTGYSLGPSGQDVLSRASATPTLDDQTRVLRFLLDVAHTDLFEVATVSYSGETKARSILAHLKSRLAASGVDLRISGFDVSVAGSEFARRRLLGRVMQDELMAGRDPGLVMHTYLPGIDLQAVEQAVNAAVQTTLPEFDGIQRRNLTINAAICLARRARRFGPDPDTDPNARKIVRPKNPSIDGPRLSIPVVREAATRLATNLATNFGGKELTSEDVSYLEDLITILGVGDTTSPAADEADELMVIIEDAVHQTLSHYGLETNRAQLVTDLTDHVRRLHKRKSELFFFHNALQNNLRSRSPFLYDVAVHLAKRLENELRLEFSPDDIGLFAVYLGLHTQDDQSQSTDEVPAILVCPPYHPGLRKRLLSALTLRYSDRLRITEVVESDDDAIGRRCDLILSTTAPEGTPFPTVRVGALLSPLDYAAIDAAISRAAETRFRQQVAVTLGRFLSPELFFTNVVFEDAETTIRFLVDSLERTGAVGSNYLESVLERERRASTVFLERFAVPHSMEFLAETTRIAILIPRTAIRWGQSTVSAVVMPAVSEKDYPEFSQIYQSLVELLYDPALFAGLTRVRTFEELNAFLGRELQAP